MPSAGSLLHQRLVEQRDAMTAAEAALRAGEAAGLHDLRVAMRRIRCALATFRPLLDLSVTEPLRDELSWAAALLGRARDAEVVAGLTAALLDAVRPEVVDEAVTGLRARLELDAAAAADVVDETLASTRFVAAQVLLDAVVAAPPFTDGAQRPARPVAREVLLEEVARVRHRVEQAGAAEPEVRAARLHRVRKAAKRLRYAAEAVAPVTGSAVRRVARRAADVQTVLGDHHDAVVVGATLRHLALDEGAGEAAAFLLGHLEADEERAAARLEHRAAKALGRLDEAAADALGDPPPPE